MHASDQISRVQAVATAILARGVIRQPVRLQVISTSKVPLLAVGDWVWVAAADPATLRCGDVVVVQRGTALITHRVVANTRGWITTKGDNSDLADPPVNLGAFVGRVTQIERCGRVVRLDRHWTQHLIGWLSRAEARLLTCVLAVAARLHVRPPVRLLVALTLPAKLVRRGLVYWTLETQRIR